jgi:hypothetical protein
MMPFYKNGVDSHSAVTYDRFVRSLRKEDMRMQRSPIKRMFTTIAALGMLTAMMVVMSAPNYMTWPPTKPPTSPSVSSSAR